MSITIDIDTGGTFTDGFVVRDGEPHAVKVLTTPHDLAVCFRDVLESAAASLGTTVPDMLRETVSVRYATTVGTNAVIQRRGPRLGLLAGRSLPEDDAEAFGVGLFVDPLMVRRFTGGDEGRNGAGATDATAVIRSLLDDSARGLVAALDDEAGGEAAERDVRAAFEEHYPRHCLDTVPLLLASDVTVDADDARRTATALFNAYVHPDVADYLYRAEDHLRDEGYRHPLLIVHNDGGCARVAKTIAGKTYNSGPMAGLLGGHAVASLYGLETLVTLDMGGTSLDVGIIRGGEVPMLANGRVEDVEVSFPLPDLVPLGAGGGSIAWLDDGELRVGPRSAGAKPGPACFGFGGEEPTVTDADVVLGILRPEAFLGGSMPIDAAAARHALARIAEPLGIEPEEAAERVRATVHRVTGTRLAAELEQRGVDPAGATVLGFGGNGATHCAGIAQAAGMRDVLTLPFSPVFSAFGASTADVRHRYEVRAGAGAEEALRERALRDMRGEGFAPADVAVEVTRRGAGGEERVAFEAIGALPHVDIAALASSDGERGVSETRGVRWPGTGIAETQVVTRASLRSGDRLAGPALVDSPTTTCAVPPGWALEIDDRGAERMSFEEEETS